MTKEIIVNAGEMESRVAILENGRLMELHIEREPKIVGNIYKGRVTKVLKGMDAAFVDIGIERNAFLSVSDVVPEEDDDEGHGNGRISRARLPAHHPTPPRQPGDPRAGGARPDGHQRRAHHHPPLAARPLHGAHAEQRHLRRRVAQDRGHAKNASACAPSPTYVRPENYSLIVRTEAEGKSEEELRQDLTFLLDMARPHRGRKRSRSHAPSLVHGDLNLIFRLIRDAFTRDVNRLVVDSPSAYENVLELVGDDLARA